MNAWLTQLEPKAHARWILTALTLSLFSMAGMVIAVPDIDRHPITFVLSASWVIGGIVGLATRDRILRKDPWQFHFARWEREGRVYRCVGVEIFCWLLKHTPMGWLNPALRLKSRKSDLENLLRQMNFAERAHLIGGAITLVLSLGYTFTGHGKVGLAFAVVTVFSHFYPLITQRWNRGRVARVARRMAWDLHEGKNCPPAFRH